VAVTFDRDGIEKHYRFEVSIGSIEGFSAKIPRSEIFEANRIPISFSSFMMFTTCRPTNKNGFVISISVMRVEPVPPAGPTDFKKVGDFI
jgi:hypothetical protein